MTEHLSLRVNKCSWIRQYFGKNANPKQFDPTNYSEVENVNCLGSMADPKLSQIHRTIFPENLVIQDDKDFIDRFEEHS